MTTPDPALERPTGPALPRSGSLKTRAVGGTTFAAVRRAPAGQGRPPRRSCPLLVERGSVRRRRSDCRAYSAHLAEQDAAVADAEPARFSCTPAPPGRRVAQEDRDAPRRSRRRRTCHRRGGRTGAPSPPGRRPGCSPQTSRPRRRRRGTAPRGRDRRGPERHRGERARGETPAAPNGVHSDDRDSCWVLRERFSERLGVSEHGRSPSRVDAAPCARVAAAPRRAVWGDRRGS
jgi:hypothetical protein